MLYYDPRTGQYYNVPQPAPQLAPSGGTNWLVLILVALLVLKVGSFGPITGQSADFKAPVPTVLCMIDSDAAATKAFDEQHPGAADVITSIAAGSARDWVTKQQGGVWVTYGTKEPEPDPKMSGQPLYDAYQAWSTKYNKRVPMIIAAGPSGKGYSGDVPDGTIQQAQDKAKQLLAPIAAR